MKGLKNHTRKDREALIEKLLPKIQDFFGDNLVAFATQGSFSRNRDSDFSDLELIVFVREMAKNKKWDGKGIVFDGMLIELVWTTKEHYLETTKELNSDWFISGSDLLLPIINPDFIDDLNSFRPERLEEKCLEQAKKQWPDTQEATGKVLNAIAMKNTSGLPLLLYMMFLEMLKTLSFLNHLPYTTLAKFVEEAERFEIKPKRFNVLAECLTSGFFSNPAYLAVLIQDVFTGFEDIFESKGISVYSKDLDDFFAK